jgi:hypothetical protein
VLLRRALLVGASLAFACLASELAFRGWLALRGRPYDSAAGRAQIERLASHALDLTPRALAAAERRTPARYDQERFLHPFLGWEQRSSEGQWNAERTFERAARPGTYDIVVVGGSVSQLFAVRGFGRLRRLLSADPRLAGRELRLSCWGRAGYKAPQTSIAVEWLLANGGRPDAVILIDGFNEVAIGSQNAELGVHPLFPSAMHWTSLVQQGTFDRETADHLVDARLSQRRIERLSGRALAWGLHRSALLQRFVLARLQADLGRVQAAFGESSRAMQQGVEREVLAGPPGDPRLETTLHAVARCWAESSRSLAGVCRERGIAYLHVLQPTLHDPGAKPMSEDEVRDGAIGTAWGRGVLDGYPLLRAAGAELAAQGVAFLDASRIFADVRETLYLDNCHFGDEGNRLLAEAIAAAFLERLPRELAEPSGPAVSSNEPVPQRWSSTGWTGWRRLDGVLVYVCMPDGELAFDVPDGARAASGSFGMLQATYDPGATDGVRFTVAIEGERGLEPLLERYLDPRAIEADRGFQTFDVLLPPGSGRRIVLLTGNEPGKHALGDGAYWADIAIR